MNTVKQQFELVTEALTIQPDLCNDALHNWLGASPRRPVAMPDLGRGVPVRSYTVYCCDVLASRLPATSCC
jgi:hypothetical protein